MQFSLGVDKNVNQPTTTTTTTMHAKTNATHHGGDVRHRVPKSCHLEHFGVLCDGVRAQKATVAPADDGDAFGVDQGVLRGGVLAEDAGGVRGDEHVVDVILADVAGQAGIGTFWMLRGYRVWFWRGMDDAQAHPLVRSILMACCPFPSDGLLLRTYLARASVPKPVEPR